MCVVLVVLVKDLRRDEVLVVWLLDSREAIEMA
jgi:hypothetical protein